MVLKEGWSHQVVIYQGGLSSGDHSPGWCLIRVVLHQGYLSPGWSFIRVTFHQGGLSSGWSFIKVTFHGDDLLSGWPFTRMISHQGDLSSVWSVRVAFHQGDLFWWHFIKVVFRNTTSSTFIDEGKRYITKPLIHEVCLVPSCRSLPRWQGGEGRVHGWAGTTPVLLRRWWVSKAFVSQLLRLVSY